MTEVQEMRCQQIIHSTAAKAAAIGVGSGLLAKITLGVAGLAKRVPLAALEIKMVIDLGKVFGVDITESVAEGLVGSILATIAGKVGASIASDLLAGVPIVGEVTGGATAAAVVEALGWAVANHLESNDLTEEGIAESLCSNIDMQQLIELRKMQDEDE